MRFLMHEYRFQQEILLHGEQASEKKKRTSNVRRILTNDTI